MIKQAANVYLCTKDIIPLIMNIDKLKEELTNRNVDFKDIDSRDTLVHLLEMDILSQSERNY